MDQITWDALKKYKLWGSFDGEYPAASRSYFSPYDGVHEVILAVIKSVKMSLHVAMYGYDDEVVNEAILAAANNPTIRVKVALDSTQAAGQKEGSLLTKWPSSSYMNSLVIGQSVAHAIMHNKIIVADDCMLSGSTNMSTSAQTQQDNLVTLEWNSRKAVEGMNVIERIFQEMVANPHVEGYRHYVGGATNGI